MRILFFKQTKYYEYKFMTIFVILEFMMFDIWYWFNKKIIYNIHKDAIYTERFISMAFSDLHALVSILLP